MERRRESNGYDVGNLATLLPIDEAAAQEGVSRTTIYRLIRLGLLKKFRAPGVDRRTYVDVDVLREIRAHPPLRVVE
jgi:predicted site-specific integrase-resolvase